MGTETPGIKAIGHVGICVEDLEASLRFWRDGLGFDVIREWDFGKAWAKVNEMDDPKIHSRVMRRGHTTIELLEFESPGHVGTSERTPMNQLGFTHIAVWVDDIDLASARIVEHGGEILESTRTVFDHPKLTGRWLICTDPNGVRVELLEYPDGEDLIDA
jgi:catechol 2,3-dioxygenase-like lactoylglutathione lyase family enzyme